MRFSSCNIPGKMYNINIEKKPIQRYIQEVRHEENSGAAYSGL